MIQNSNLYLGQLLRTQLIENDQFLERNQNLLILIRIQHC